LESLLLGISLAYNACVRRIIFATTLMLAFTPLMPSGLAQDSVPSSAPSAAVASQAQPSPAATGQDASSVLKVCSVKFGPPCANVPPRALKAPSPKLPREALQKKIDGHVLLDVVVDKNGLAHDIRVLQPLGYGCDEAAIKSVEKWRFSPATMDGQPVAVEINVDVGFHGHFTQ
jgi:protein TonB